MSLSETKTPRKTKDKKNLVDLREDRRTGYCRVLGLPPTRR